MKIVYLKNIPYKLRYILLLLIPIYFLNSCQKKSSFKRYISEKDSTYSIDVRSISEKINKDPKNAELYLKRANTFYFESKFNDAVEDVKISIELDSLNPVYHYKYSTFLMGNDTANGKKAISALRNAIRLNNTYIEAYLDLGKLLIARQQYSEAKEIYFQVNKLNPALPEPYFYLGIMHKEMKEIPTAIQYFEKTLMIESNYYDAIMQLGNYYSEKNDKIALTYFDRAIKINEYSDEANYAKALFLQNNHQYKDAAGLYEYVKKLNPSHIFCRYNLAYINVLFENYENAIDELTKLLELDEEYADAYSLRGFSKEKLKNSVGAYTDYHKALEFDPKNKQANDGLKRVKVNVSF